MSRRLAALALTPALLLAACGDDGGGGGSGGDGSLTALLASVPDSSENRRFVVYDDHARARALVAVEPPADPTDEDDVGEYLVELSGPEPDDLALNVSSFFDGDTLRAATGWAVEFGVPVGAMDSTVVAGELPDHIRIADGTFDVERVGDAVLADPFWGDVVVEESYAGRSYLDWGDDNDFERITAVRPVGQAGQLAVSTDRVIRTNTREGVEAALDAEAGERSSLADDPAFRSVAEALDAAGIHAALLTDEPWSAAIDGDPLSGVEVIGLGTARSAEGDDELVVVLRAEDADAAARNADGLRAIIENDESLTRQVAWSEVLEIIDLSAEGELTVARLATENNRLFTDVVFARDNLLAHE